MAQETGLTERNNLGSRASCSAALLWPLGWFALGAAMLVWPSALASSAPPCVPDSLQDELLGCFIGGEWGKPEAVVLCFIIGLVMILAALWQRAYADDA